VDRNGIILNIGIPGKVENLKNFSYPAFFDLIWDKAEEALDYCVTFRRNSELIEEICNVTDHKLKWNRTSEGQEMFVYEIFVTARGIVDKGPPSNVIIASFYSSSK